MEKIENEDECVYRYLSCVMTHDALRNHATTQLESNLIGNASPGNLSDLTLGDVRTPHQMDGPCFRREDVTSHLIGFMRLKEDKVRQNLLLSSLNFFCSQLSRDGVISFRASYGCVVYLSHKRPPFHMSHCLDGLYSLFVRSA